MNLDPIEGAKRARELVGLIAAETSVEIGLCPTFLSIPALVEAVANNPVHIGAQDVFWKESGAFTGFLSAKMLKEVGVRYVLIGHSERRGKFGKLEVAESTLGFFAETDETVNLKLKATLAEGLIPIVCVGETLAEREAGHTDQIVSFQVTKAIEGIEDLSTLVIAYEPVWAIGTGKVCDADEADRVCGVIRSALPSAYQDVVRIQYGGSVNPSNAAELFSKPNIDGGLVGGASLKPEDFIQVIRSAEV